MRIDVETVMTTVGRLGRNSFGSFRLRYVELRKMIPIAGANIREESRSSHIGL